MLFPPCKNTGLYIFIINNPDIYAMSLFLKFNKGSSHPSPARISCTKKIGKNNPKAAEIEADNAARQEWNRTADMALLSGIEEAKILEIKRTEIHEKNEPVH